MGGAQLVDERLPDLDLRRQLGELELGVLSNDEIAGYQRKTVGLAARVVREEIPIEGVEAAAVEETDVVDGDLTDLLNDIEIGLTEEGCGYQA